MTKNILTGNEAISRGFYEAGGLVASSYPGSPTVSILDSMRSYNEIYAEWGTNEKVAIEISMGASIGGARSIVSMKHVGINIASDPFMTFTQIKTKGGFLLVVGDDPGLTSSQNEQDSRFWGKFANIPILDPSTPQEAKEAVKEGLKLSEEFNTPVMIRLTSRLCHARGIVELEDRIEHIPEGFVEDQSRYCMLPPFANAAQHFMKERMVKLEQYNNININNKLESKGSSTLIITSSLCYENLKEIDTNVDILKLAMVWPLPIDYIKTLSEKYERLVVIEETLGFIEDELKIRGLNVEGKVYFPFTGEITVESIKIGLKDANILDIEMPLIEKEYAVRRTPMLCSGCPHRPIFHILKMAKATVIGDIGCYSLGIQEPFEVHKTNISMGASLGMALGIVKAQNLSGNKKPIVATIGDGTFFHSGMTGFLQLSSSKENITVIVMDNRTTAMTGGQITPTTSEYFKDLGTHSVNIPKVLNSFGIEDVTVVDQFKYNETKKEILDAMKRDGLSVIVTTRPCALNFKVKEPHFYVDSSVCISCRNCIKTNCPPISMKLYKGKEKKNSYIDPSSCVGCSVCSQVCPVGAIKRSNIEK
ncbi:indolepyruvate ferredoxin oxidoreductase alpha subunit [Clostridium algidicarnis DSM 15099]|uniref:Indolepyruvate oxidoreductase subunit IorA n=1 Tax=Clostridium algidicarnis DSM 15099 TaxID=1121295 RepID=A0A2S6FVE3_9CLOT|nr:thiamine pyrophosphate-dependent enzyme [Clostridium algidicarnis]PPK45580.1 indolepyruvate ferredoxin oxidoreductase alpha subunit [Clostridium algidicarnis DSM 15099]